MGTLSKYGHPKIAEQEVVVSPKQQIPRLDIAVNQFLVVSMLQGRGDLPDIWNNDLWCERHASGMTLLHRAIWRILHDEKGDISLNTKIQKLHDMRVL